MRAIHYEISKSFHDNGYDNDESLTFTVEQK